MTGIVILALCYVLSHFYRSFLAVLSPQLTAELGMTPDELSTALGAWFMAFALSQFLVGVLLDRFGPKSDHRADVRRSGRWEADLLLAWAGSGYGRADRHGICLASAARRC